MNAACPFPDDLLTRAAHDADCLRMLACAMYELRWLDISVVGKIVGWLFDLDGKKYGEVFATRDDIVLHLCLLASILDDPPADLA